MPGDCSSSWQYGCELSIGYLWQSTFLLERLVLIVLALMLARVALILIRVSILSVRRAGSSHSGSRRVLAVELSPKLRSLRLTFSIAPYLGLLGTSFGIVDTLSAVLGMPTTRQGLLIGIAAGMDAAFLSTAAGILIAVLATCLHNYLRVRLDSLERELPGDRLTERQFPLRLRLSTFPFPIIAIPVLAVSLFAFMVFPSFFGPRGLRVHPMAIGTLENKAPSAEPIVVAVVSGGAMAMPTVYVNAKKTTWQELENKLQSESSGRLNSIVYVQADKDIPWHLVIYVIDVARQFHAEVFLMTATPDIHQPRRHP